MLLSFKVSGFSHVETVPLKLYIYSRTSMARTDGLFTTAGSNSFLGPLEQIP